MSNSHNHQQHAEQVIRTVPILIFALLMGLISFAGLGLFQGLRGPNASPGSGAPPAPAGTLPGGISAEPMLIVMGVLVVFAAFAQVLFGKLAVSRARSAVASLKTEQEKRDAIAPTFMIMTIMRAAVAEGAGLLGAMIVFSTGDVLGLIGVAFSVAFLAILLPARSRFESLYRAATETRFGM